MSAVRRVVDFTPAGNPMNHGLASSYVTYGCRCEACTAANTERVRRQKARRDPAETPTHGSAASYSNWGCRCELCSAAHAEKMRLDYESRLRRPEDAPHGTRSGYNAWGCRCELCRAAESDRSP